MKWSQGNTRSLLGEHRGAAVGTTAPMAFFALHWFPLDFGLLREP